MEIIYRRRSFNKKQYKLVNNFLFLAELDLKVISNVKI